MRLTFILVGLTLGQCCLMRTQNDREFPLSTKHCIIVHADCKRHFLTANIGKGRQLNHACRSNDLMEPVKPVCDVTSQDT